MQLLMKYQSRILLIEFILSLVMSDFWFPESPRRHLLIYLTIFGSLSCLLLVLFRTVSPKVGAVVIGLFLVCLATISFMFWFAGHPLASLLVLVMIISLASALLEFYWLMVS